MLVDSFPIKPEIATLQIFTMSKPILSKELETEVEATVVRYRSKAKWRNWGLAHYRKQGSCVILYGPPGTGKTITAQYLCQKAGLGIRTVDLSLFGSKTPGENERNIEVAFREAARDEKAIVMDECDSILWDRQRAGGESQWMVSVINKLLAELGVYPHLAVLMTNRIGIIDPALDRRVLAKIEVPRPAYPERLRLWQTKIPKKFPVQPTPVQMEDLATLDLTGAEIENAVLRCAEVAIASHKDPTFTLLCNVAKKEIDKRTPIVAPHE